MGTYGYLREAVEVLKKIADFLRSDITGLVLILAIILISFMIYKAINDDKEGK